MERPSTRLPRRILRRASREERAFHAASFQGTSPKDAAAASLFAPSLLYVEVLRRAPAPLRPLLKSRYVEMIARLHYGHHVGRGGNCNFIFGADAAFGQLRKPNLPQLLRMRDLKIIGAYWGPRRP